MAALAEILVEEWLNRQGFFTVHGIKDGVDEIDLLGVRPTGKTLEGWHVEVQASFRPIGYISKLTEKLSRSLGKKKTTALKRTQEQLRQCVDEWVRIKFTNKNKVSAREKAWHGLKWKFVHAVVREPEELAIIATHDVTIIPLYHVLGDLCTKSEGRLSGAAGTDLAEIVEYYKSYKVPANPSS